MNKRVACHVAGLRIVVFVFVIMIACTWRQAYAEEQKLACAEELAQYCKGIKPGGGRLLVCLKEHESDLSPTCRDKVAGLEKRLKEAERICAVDIEKFCKGVQRGEGRIAKCLKEHIKEISPECREEVYGVRKMIPESKASEQ